MDRSDEARPAVAPPDAGPAYVSHRLLTVDGERFRIGRRRGSRGGVVEYDYDWLSGPNPGYGFSVSGGVEPDDGEHRQRVRAFLSDIDPATGYLRED